VSEIDSYIREVVRDELAQGESAEIRRETMTADEVATLLGLDRKTVYDYANLGEIPHIRLGRKLLFSRRALMAWLSSCEVASREKGE
jgi:excisionase family DNA binding protein